MPAEGRLPAVDETLTIAPRAALAHPRQRRAGGADGAHQVELERRLPVGVGQLVELADLGAADVVDEAVDAAEPLDRGRDDPLRLAGPREVGRDVHVAGPFAGGRC